MLLKSLHQPIYLNRIRVLTEWISRRLLPDDLVLDVGSGSGMLAASLRDAMQAANQPIRIEGIEKYPRGNEAIKTLAFDGYKIPCADNHYDVTILADVVHHEDDYMALLNEVVRVTKRMVVIKDHVPQGFLAYPRICLMDWAANNPYGVKCLYRYFTVSQWRAIYDTLKLTVISEQTSLDLYQEPYNTIFGKKLQYLAFLQKSQPGRDDRK